MSVIDEKGKLGGKINIIDLIVILVVLAAIVAVAVLGCNVNRAVRRLLGMAAANTVAQGTGLNEPRKYTSLSWSIRRYALSRSRPQSAPMHLDTTRKE